MSMTDKLLDSYKPLIIIPVVITLIALAVLVAGGLQEGIDLKGGSIAVVQLEKPVSNDALTSIVETTTGNQQVTVTT